jgi:ketosteroid isomerase-like protein
MGAAIRLLIAILFFAVPSHAGQRAALSDQEILVQLERQWEAAFLQKDVGFVAGLLADEFVAIYPDGTRGDKAHELSLVAALDQQIESSTLGDFAIAVNGDRATVTFTRTLLGPVQGVRTAITYRFTDMFVWRAGRWQCISSQSHKVFVP